MGSLAHMNHCGIQGWGQRGYDGMFHGEFFTLLIC